MGATVFYAGVEELATLANTFSVAGVPTDPTGISLAVTTPAGVATTYTYAAAAITRTGTGVYTKDIACTEAGIWQYVWTGTGTASDVVAGTWEVRSTLLSRLYCTPEMLKGRVGITDGHDDSEILSSCFATTAWIDDHCGRPEYGFRRTTATRFFDPDNEYCLAVPDLVAVTSIATDTAGDGTFATAWAVSDYQLAPVNAQGDGESRPYSEILAVADLRFPVVARRRRGALRVIGTWGWPARPSPVVEASKIVSGDYLKLGSMAFGVMGYESYGAARARMSNPALAMLAPYRLDPIRSG